MRGRATVFGLCLLAGAACPPRSAVAQPPSYVVVQPPTRSGYPQGTAYGVTSQGYSWGWFGARARPQTVHHRGYYGDRWMWTLR